MNSTGSILKSDTLSAEVVKLQAELERTKAECISLKKFVSQVAGMLMWSCDSPEGVPYQECEEPSDGFLDSHCALMELIEASRELLRCSEGAGLVDAGGSEVRKSKARTSKKDYAIEVYGPPIKTWLATLGDEDQEGDTPPITTDPEFAESYEVFSEARKACRAAVKRYPSMAFKVGILD